MAINSVTSREIEELSAEQLTKLLQMLLCLEVKKKDLQGFYYVSQKITTADGGEDGRITVNDATASNWLGHELTLFQCKATNLTPTKISAEFLDEDTTTHVKYVKPVIKDVLDKGGDYNLFMSIDASTRRGIDNRIDKMEEACKSVGLNYRRAQFKVYDANKIAEWATEYISTVAYVLECNGKSRPDIFRTWHQWGQDIQVSLGFKFQQVAVIDKITELKNLVKSENAVRVIGHSGIGKTRLVYETFKHDPSFSDTQQNILNASVVYYDYGLVQGNELAKYVLSFKENTVGIIVIDNCPNDMHAALAALVKNNSKLKIVTIDFSLDTEEKNIIRLNKDGQKETVKQMLHATYPAFTTSEIDRLAELAEGYPRMVELLQDAITTNGLASINTQLPKNFIEKLVFGHQARNDSEFDILKACAIFSEFNFIDEEIEELITDQKRLDEYKIHRDFISSSVCDPAVTDSVFYRTCRKFKNERNILERRGYTLTVVPTPLAANLAAEWILDYPPDKFQDFCAKLIGAGLIDAFCKRLRTLDQIERAKSLVAKLWGPQGPFVSAEVLNTEMGSRLFRSVVEVNPEATVAALIAIYADFSLSEIRGIDKGRRNLVWSLEKLVFRKESYDEAAIILAKFAAGETEKYGNNATNQFLQTFHIFIPGTEVPLLQRLSVIDYCLDEDQREFTDLAINSISHCLKNHGFSRMGGAEEQGFSTKLTDYSPQTWDEVYEYWRSALEKLTGIIDKYPNMIGQAKATIAANMRGIFGQNRGEILVPAIAHILKIDSSLWDGAINALRSTLKYETLDENNQKLATELLAQLIPQNWENKLRFIVSVPDWDYSDPDMYRGQEKSIAAIKALIAELQQQNIAPQIFLPQLLTGEQRKGVLFGRVLAETGDDQYDLGLVILKYLRQVERSKQSVEVLAGFISAVNKTAREKLINDILSDDQLNHLLFILLRYGNTSADDIFKLFKLVDLQQADITSFTNIIVHVGDTGLSVEQVIQLCDKLESYGELGKWTAFVVYHQLSYSEESLWKAFRSLMRRIMLETNFITLEVKHSSIDLFRYSHTAQRLFAEGRDEELAAALSDQLAQSVKSEHFPYGSFQLHDLTKLLMEDYFTIIFDRLSPSLLSNSIEYYNVKELLGSRNGSHAHSGLLFQGDTASVIEWCEKNSPKGPDRIAYLMPVFSNQNSGSLWHPFSRVMIDRFNKLPGLLNEVSANMGSFGWVGSSVPYFEKLGEMMKELFDHPSLKVRKWAKSGYNYYQKQIKLEILNEEQHRIS